MLSSSEIVFPLAPPAAIAGETPPPRRRWWSGEGLIEALSAAETTGEFGRVMTLLLLMGFTENSVRTATPLMPLIALGLLFRSVRARWEFWILITGVLVVRHTLSWHVMDNHQWLITYWCLAIGLAHSPWAPADALATNGRLLVGTCFAVAAIWKLASRDFLDGSFFQLALVGNDRRFAWLGQLLGGSPEEALHQSRSAIEAFVRPYSATPSLTLTGPPSLLLWGRLLAIWTVLIELAIAVFFLWPVGKGPSRARHLVLITFVVTTYLSAPVIGFGWLLLAMGMAQAGSAGPRTRLLYVAAFALLPLYGMPVGRLFK